MYNESRKRAFVEDRTSSDSTAAKMTQIFSWFEPYEEKWGMDLSLQSTECLQPAFSELTGLRSQSAELVLHILKEYDKWCVRNGYETSGGIQGIEVDTADKIKNQMVASPKHLLKILDEYFDEAVEETVDITYRVFLWMAFSGLEDTDAIRVTSNCVDLQNLRIEFEGHAYQLYKEAIDDFTKACSLTAFQYYHPNYSIRRPRADGNVVMRGFRSPTVDLKTIRPVINKRFASDEAKVSDKDKVRTADDKVRGEDKSSQTKRRKRQKSHMSYGRICLSGIFYRAYEREKMGFPVDFSWAVAKTMKKKEETKGYTLTKTRTITTIANQLEREYFTDYEKWKCAFKK